MWVCDSVKVHHYKRRYTAVVYFIIFAFQCSEDFTCTYLLTYFVVRVIFKTKMIFSKRNLFVITLTAFIVSDMTTNADRSLIFTRESRWKPYLCNSKILFYVIAQNYFRFLEDNGFLFHYLILKLMTTFIEYFNWILN